MACGMFGKLPSKRDFVSYNMPRPFLNHWEEWLQVALAQSKHALGSGWQDIFLGFPIWHFWCGQLVFGQAVTGALMPSVDGMGRYFPLSVCACEPQGMRLVPPPHHGLEAWHTQSHGFLLHMLQDEFDTEPSSLLETLSFPPTEPAQLLAPHEGRYAVWTPEDQALEGAFQTLRTMNHDMVHGERCYWWTMGGVDHKAQLVAFRGRPEPSFLAALMTGQFS